MQQEKEISRLVHIWRTKDEVLEVSKGEYLRTALVYYI